MKKYIEILKEINRIIIKLIGFSMILIGGFGGISIISSQNTFIPIDIIIIYYMVIHTMIIGLLLILVTKKPEDK